MQGFVDTSLDGKLQRTDCGMLARPARFTALPKAIIVPRDKGYCLMAKRGHEHLRSVAPTDAQPATALPGRSIDSAAFRELAGPPATFNFSGRVLGVEYPSLSPAQQESLSADFAQESRALIDWCAREHWLPTTLPTELRIFVSDEYRNSKALLPAAVGQHGRMEFPAWKIVAGEAPIMHELTHVYFPNGNRFIAEALAIYLQATLGSNPAFPNFGRNLHALARDLLLKMLPDFARRDPSSLENLRLTELDKIATPSSLRLRVGLILYQDDPSGQAYIYALVGSFAQFLIDNHGIDRFRALYSLTPLKPFGRDAGLPDRWRDVYGLSLGELETEWKRNLCSDSGFT
jgi:hypothetical protein